LNFISLLIIKSHISLFDLKGYSIISFKSVIRIDD
jgi:hypothetical protein